MRLRDLAWQLKAPSFSPLVTFFTLLFHAPLDVQVSEELRQEFVELWEANAHGPLAVRNHVIASVCPQIFGLFTVKVPNMGDRRLYINSSHVQ